MCACLLFVYAVPLSAGLKVMILGALAFALLVLGFGAQVASPVRGPAAAFRACECHGVMRGIAAADGGCVGVPWKAGGWRMVCATTAAG
jgi:uncharacterized membrane protein